jgi:hypothetical protein
MLAFKTLRRVSMLHSTTPMPNSQFTNYIAYSGASPLIPLHYYITNEDIAGFPATTGVISFLNRKSVPNLQASYFN